MSTRGLLGALTRMMAKLDRWSQAHITSVCVSLTSWHPDVDHLPLTPDYGRVRTLKCVNVHKLCRWEGIQLACNNVEVKYSWQTITTQVYICT